MKLQNFTVIFVIILIPIILLMSMYITNGIKTIKYQSLYDMGLLNATHDAIYAFEQNTSNDEFSGNPEIKRDILKSSVKMFEKSLSNACNISSYSTEEIEEYIPAIVFGMYDGFYMYAPSYNSITGKYEHSLKNYVYYSETLQNAYGDVVITYSLDNHITVSGKFNNDDGYEIKKGYLMQIDQLNTNQKTGNEYAGIKIEEENINGEVNSDGKNYHKFAFQFTHWFLNKSGLKNIVIDGVKPFDISSTNDPENENSNFVKHKRKIIKEKIEGVLNSTITAYSERTWGQVYKMPKLLEEDLEKIYSNISMLTFFQGKSIGLTKYNGYCVANSTNSKEYVNPNLMYFTDESGEYHDIRCSECGTTLNGYRIGAFEKKKVEKLDASGNIIYDAEGKVEYEYKYDHNELACYNCINGNINTSTTVYEYVKSDGGSAEDDIKTAYWTSLGRERYDPNKITPIDLEIDVEFDVNGGNGDFSAYNKTYAYNTDIVFPPETEKPTKTGYEFGGWTDIKDEQKDIKSAKALTDITYYAYWIPNPCDITFDWEEGQETETLPYGSQVYFPTPYRTGYNLVGWKDASGATVDVNNEYVYGDKIYYAIWELIEWDITFDYMDGRRETITIPDGKYIKDYIGNNIFNPTRTGYVFKSWSADESNLSESTVNLENQIANAEKTYYACWGYNVKFIFTAEEQLDYVYAIGEKINMPQNPERLGHEFVAWKDESGNTVSTDQYATSHRTFTAQWRRKTYQIAFDLNGGTGDITTPIDVESGTNIPFPTSSEVSKEGYELKGWSENPTSATGITSAEATKDTTYYAIWKKIEYTIRYNGNGNTGGSTPDSRHIYGEAKNLTANGFTRTGYKFVGWSRSATGSVEYADQASVVNLTRTNGEVINLYAVWEGNTYTVRYEGNGNTGGSTPNSTHKVGEEKTLTANGFTKTGHTFIGWATSASGSVVYSNQQSVINLATEDGAIVTLYAKWRANTYTVAYNANGGAGRTASSTHTYGVAKKLTANGFTRTGYTFQGWAETASGSVKYSNQQSVTNLTDRDGATVTLYAVWRDSEAPVITSCSYNATTKKINIIATDNVGIVEYSVGSSKTTISSSPSINVNVSVTTSGTYTITVKDAAGNTATRTVTVSKKPVFVEGNKNVVVNARGTGARYVKWDIVATGDVDLNLEIFIENSLASDVVKYEIEVVHVNTGEIRARGTLDSPTGTANISMTQRTTNGSIYIDYYIRIKAYNSAGEYTQKDATVWVSTTYAAGNTYAVGIQKNRPLGVNVGSKRVELNF